MRAMHTSLPDWLQKLTAAVYQCSPLKTVVIKGLENLQYAKFQSLRTGRVELAVTALAADSRVENVEIVVVPRIPETMHTIIIKGFDKSGSPVRAILENTNILHPTEDVELVGFAAVEDRRPKLGEH
ncbi:hypothetical protein [Sporomusa termitida]|uniref:Uncharacterized protein n=1 Tax=Sporomusa termitida TaxID=2377 RepID=A0A517DXM6_9FIRM|nr:hypothetical protein [Sporomusa termitida]QDR81996.1 hypothetical protein SPTER_34170 [Sporomusa termitida]